MRIGTSGWTYEGWRGPFYPEEVAKKNWLSWYADKFATTEINGSFYRTPSEEAVRAWRRETPPDFVFAWKASKFITNWKRLQETCENSIALLQSRVKLLGPKLGPILFQLPRNFEADRERLARFITMLPARRRYAFEFRHASWYEAPILDVLRDNDIALCISDHHHAPSPWIATASLVYVRGHGPGGRYRDNYPEATLQAWKRRIRRWQAEGRQVSVYFDNDEKSAAPTDAERLVSALSKSRRTTRSKNIQESRLAGS
ncbi:MAG: DUF72 domain-containing protein [Hyphomicrobiales bacterium]|nr:MAG: DUF72 domain-containing protein [Hyphomicrobiales bacterium]